MCNKTIKNRNRRYLNKKATGTGKIEGEGNIKKELDGVRHERRNKKE